LRTSLAPRRPQAAKASQSRGATRATRSGSLPMGETQEADKREGGGHFSGRASRETEEFIWKIRRGAIVIVFGVSTLELVRHLIYDLRGSDFARSVRVKCCYRENDVRGALAGHERPVDIHPAFWTQANEDAAKAALELSERANERFSKNAKKTECRT